MNLDKLPHWLQPLIASLGGTGLFVIGFLDSSVLSLPVINDLLVIHLSIKHPGRMPFYASMAVLGSLAGSLLLYFLAKKGGEVMFHKVAGSRAQRIREWVDQNDFLSIAVPSVLPPPMPFKAFVLAAGVFQMSLRTFMLALVVGRGFRYFAVGYLAVRFGDDALRVLKENRLEVILILVAFAMLSWLLTRFAFHSPKPAA